MSKLPDIVTAMEKDIMKQADDFLDRVSRESRIFTKDKPSILDRIEEYSEKRIEGDRKIDTKKGALIFFSLLLASYLVASNVTSYVSNFVSLHADVIASVVGSKGATVVASIFIAWKAMNYIIKR